MTDDGVLRRKAREAIERRSLPDRSPDRTWGGLGAGAACTICGATVKSDQAELELEFVEGPDSAPATYKVHARCFAVWEIERHGLMPAGPPDAPPGYRRSHAVAVAGR